MIKTNIKKRGAILAWVLSIFVVVFITATLTGYAIVNNAKMSESYNDTNDMDNAVNSAINIGAYYYKTSEEVKTLLSKDEKIKLNLKNDYIYSFISKTETLSKFNYEINLENMDKNTTIINVKVKNKNNTKIKEASGKINKINLNEKK